MPKSSITQICILGSESAGKTCFIGGLGVLAEAERKSEFHISGRNIESQTHLNELKDALHAQQWPAATTKTRLLELDVRYQEAILQLVVLDYRGEEFRRAFYNLDNARVTELWAHLEGVEVVLLMLDVDLDLEPGQFAEAEDKQRRHERLNAILQAIIQVCHAQIKANKRTAPPDVAVVLSKADKHPEMNAKYSPLQYMKARAPQFLQRLVDWAPRVKVFAVSAVGKSTASTNSLDIRPVLPPIDLQPVGYRELFEWILWRKAAPDRRKWIKLAVAVIVLFLLLFVGWWGQLEQAKSQLRDNVSAVHLARIDNDVWFPSTRYKSRLDQVVEAKIIRAKSQLGAAPSLIELDEIAHEMDALKACKNSTCHDQANAVLVSVQRQRRTTMYATAKDAYDHMQAGFADAASAFLKAYPQGSDADDVREMVSNRQKNDRDRERSLIKEIRPTEFNYLAKKADAMAGYIAKYGKVDQSVDEMTRAETLARRLAATSTYTVRLQSFGTFADRRRHQIHISRNGNEVRLFEGGTATSSSWDGNNGTFQVQWEPGDELRVWVLDCRWYAKNTEAASQVEKSPLSLQVLCGKRKLSYGEGWDASHFASEPYVTFELDGFSPEDWRVLRDWVFPGNKW